MKKEYTNPLFQNCKISQIYVGKDHYCRCGCGGEYYGFNPNSPFIRRTLTRAYNTYKKDPSSCEIFNGDGTQESWINIPTSLIGPGRCICVYFKGELMTK